MRQEGGVVQMEKKRNAFEMNISAIKTMIEQDGFVPGDRIPSERELAERLSISRPSVREALRTLAYLGIIETRHGGGSFLLNRDDHTYIQIIAQFLVTGDSKFEDLAGTLRLLEQSVFVQRTDWSILEAHIDSDAAFREAMISTVDNDLFERIWRQVNAFYQSFGQGELYTRAEREAFLKRS
ncbi:MULTISPECIES: FadR/GntR family transcriptional regulator [Exiguobacterium]|uniref:FadR/GntR family transcriptional regulator n=1 Tax=Exiguobacterium TaxID=33986 RepID=UPI000A77A33A|nr:MULTISPECIES: GntR family transcriptional regulator [Exiguobacterium]MCT4778846.1 GntR family transcriptional regulator [Exiguobacterium soli]